MKAPPAPRPRDPEDADIDWDVVPPPPTSAFDRIQTRTVQVARSSTRKLPAPRGRTAWVAAAFVAVFALAAAATWWVRRDAPDSDRDLLVRVIATAEGFQPSYLTADDEQAEAYVADVFGWPIGLPELPGLRLVGVGEASLSPQLSVPAFRYTGSDGEDAVVFAYDYVFLDRAEGTLDLPEAAYAKLAEPDPVDARRLGGAYLVSWRRRAVVYTAVTESEDVFERIGRAAHLPAAAPRDAEAPADSAATR